MDPSKVPNPPFERSWDADDFEIPSLKPDKKEFRKAVTTNGVNRTVVVKDKAYSGPIYLGPHGAPPCQLKQQELNTSSAKKSKQKQKLKDLNKKGVILWRENSSLNSK